MRHHRPKNSPHALLIYLAVAGLLALLAGCGSSGGSETSGAAGGTGKEGSGSEPGEMPALSLQPGFVEWPYFGRVPERTHYLPDDKVDRIELDPPLRQAWSVSTHGLIEFPPAIHHGVGYVINKYGNGKAVRLRDHKVIAELKLDPNKGEKPIDVTAPAYADGNVYGAFLDGSLVAGDPQNEKVVWKDHLHSELESSPLIYGGTLYIGTNTQGVQAFDAGTGKRLWQFKGAGEFKASPSYHEGVVFDANYESTMFALDAKTGKVKWQTDTSKVAPGGEGGFFSSPAVAFGSVFAARDDGTVYAFDEQTGKVKWAFPAGAAVYGSPAVAQVPGTPPTVYIGSESGDGSFYALDAKTGKVRWQTSVGGPIPGTATVIGHTVYTSTFQGPGGKPRTLGFDVVSHKRTFEIAQAGYTPMVSDGKRLFLVGYYTLIGLEPVHRHRR
jgi:outer membrane protein assembly factor BamB